MEKKRGHYLGTEVEGKWWRRYMRDGFFARGNGEYWCDERSFYFRRYLTRDPIVIPLQRVQEVQLGCWHAGRWPWGAPIVKLIWEKDDLSLSSGFVLSRDESQVRQVVKDLERRLALSAQAGVHLFDLEEGHLHYPPALLGEVRFVGMVEGVHVTGDTAYVANGFLGMRSIDIAKPREPVLIDTFRALPQVPSA